MSKAKEYLELVAEDAGPRKMYPYVGSTASGEAKEFASKHASELDKAGHGKDKAQRNADALNKYVHGDGLSHGLTPFKVRGGKVVGGRPLLERNGDDGKRRHADGSVCKAKSPETCPLNKSAEAGENGISGREHAKPRKMYPFVK